MNHEEIQNDIPEIVAQVRAKLSPTTIEGNNVIDCHLDCEFPVFLVEVTNQDWDECGKFAVVTDCGWNPLEGWREFDHRYFDTLEAARSAFDDKS